MATKYTKSLSSDFAAGLDSGFLQEQIVGAGLATGPDRIDTNDDVVDIWFGDALSGEDQATLDGIVAAHDPDDAPCQICQKCVIHEYVPDGDDTRSYKTINYKTGLDRRLEAVKTFSKGELVKVVFYAEVTEDGDVSVPVVEERYSYTYDGLGLHWRREGEIQWYDTEGELLEGATKPTTKFYNGLDSIDASEQRRSNVNKGLQMAVLGLMMQTMLPLGQHTDLEILEIGRAFMLSIRDDLLRWVDSDDITILTSVTNATDDWLDNVVNLVGPDTTIRDYMLYELSDPEE